MVKHIVDEFSQLQLRQMDVLMMWDALIQVINSSSPNGFIDLNNYHVAIKGLTARALEYDVTAIAPAMVNVGDRLLHFKTWLGRYFIAFTEKDKQALCDSKIALIPDLIGALNSQRGVLYGKPQSVSVANERLVYFAPTFPDEFIRDCLKALWIDLDTQPDRYLSKTELVAAGGCIDPQNLTTEPDASTDLKVSSLKVSMFDSFNQQPVSLEPIARTQYIVFVMTELTQNSAF